MKDWLWLRVCNTFIHAIYLYTNSTNIVYINLFFKWLMCFPHILLPSDTNVEIKACVHKNISLSIYFHYILIFLSEFEATTKRVWQARWVQCQKKTHTKPGQKMTAERWNKQVKAHIVCVDVPCHVTVRHKLSIHVASDLAVSPATVDVNDADHVPLKRKESDWEDLVANYTTRPQRHARKK